jgi:hypothetical protein
LHNAETERIRVVLVELTGLSRDVVKGILAEAPDIELIGEVAMWEFSGPDPPARADVAILAGPGGSLSERAHGLLKLRPLLRVLAVGHGGREGSLYELRPHRTPLGELSSHVLLGAVRTCARV